MSSRSRLLVLGLVAGAAVLGALLGGVFTERGQVAAGSTRGDVPVGDAAPAVDSALTGYTATSSTDLVGLEQAARARPRDVQTLTLLGFGYLQRWRETADASYLPRAAAALHRARDVDDRDALVVTGLGSLALTQHEFRRALVLGREARRLAPFSARPLGIVGDALLELGRYDEAFAAIERMNALEPNLASYARIAYARELIGDLPGAVAAMRLAVDASAGAREPAAWAHVELAKLEFVRGRLGSASREARVALALFPRYVFAEEQLARIDAARGRLDAGIARMRRVVEAVPLPQFVSLLADLLERAGRTREAREQVSTVGAIDRLLAAGGIRTDLESATFDADHRRGLATLVARARAARAARPSIQGDDTLAWALARTGRCAEARPWSMRSLRLGTRDPLLAFHRAYLERCLGNAAAARDWARRAVALNPAFSVRWSLIARRIAAG
jgi:tetratricopeptide (TPR) repeat protein